MKKILLVFVCAVCLNTSTSVAQGYRNPIIPGFNPDPSICRVEDDFYLVNSSFEYFPGLPIYHSRDLVNWQQIGHCLTRDSQLPLQNAWSSGGLFAPSIRWHEGLFYVICTNVSGGGNFVCTATDPAGPWSEPLKIEIDGIDPDIFWDEDGSTYIVNPNKGGICITPIDLTTGHATGTPINVWNGTGGRYPEGPHLYKKDGFYYLMIAEGGTEAAHMETIARSRDLFGPYDPCPSNPILAHGNRIGESNIIQGTGHADMIQAPDGSWWMVFLAYRTTGGYYHLTGRETYLAPVDWPTGGWPQVNGNGTVSVEMNVSTLPLHPFPAPNPVNEFNDDTPGMEWQWLRNPIRENYSTTDRKGRLRISASPASLDEIAQPSFVGRRQTENTFRAETMMSFSSTSPYEEAGMVLYQNNDHHYDLTVAKNSDGKSVVRLRVKLGKIDYTVAEMPYKGGEVRLRIEGTPETYNFYFAEGSRGEYVELGSGFDTRFLSTEVAGGFTGVMIGLYATSNGTPATGKAYFDRFEYHTNLINK
jgi:alpha-N-arabinofuranosidase